jgi:hypothetical protein
VFLKYPGQALDGDNCGKPCAELLRLDLRVAPTLPEDQKRLTILAHDAAGVPTPDPAGFPNGRRPNDDVTDIAIRVVGGANYIAALAGDGVNFLGGAPRAGTKVTANGIAKEFPYLPTPYDGRGRRHIDCVQSAGTPCVEP